MIEYKAKLNGIETMIVTEEYTSKCSFIDNEKLCKHDEYCGDRIKRGLFRSKDGYLINADINGAFNILRKAVPKFSVNTLKNGIEGTVVYPKVVTL
jgi:putative transposase